MHTLRKYTKYYFVFTRLIFIDIISMYFLFVHFLCVCSHSPNKSINDNVLMWACTNLLRLLLPSKGWHWSCLARFLGNYWLIVIEFIVDMHFKNSIEEFRKKKFFFSYHSLNSTNSHTQYDEFCVQASVKYGILI